MAKILDIYRDYKIMPPLQLHQLRVAAVASQVCDNLTAEVDREAVIKACLLHDMANIIKFNLDKPLFAEHTQADLDYWKTVQQEFIDKYGHDEHKASIEIARRLGVDDKVLDYIESVDFGKALQNKDRPELEPKICDNADLRVAPHGVVSLEERLEEGRKRYKDKIEKWVRPEEQESLYVACRNIQAQIFAHCKITPADITDQSIAPIIEQLKSYTI